MGGAPASTGGAPGCLAGAPCTCKKLVGVTECTDAGPSCACPPAAECSAEAETPCFEPCGGEPFGAWVVEETCFPATAGTHANSACTEVAQGTGGESDLRLRILDGGDLQMRGTEAWTLNARVSLSCLQIETVNRCGDATFWSDATLFSSSSPMSCAPSACGVCECEGETISQAVSGGLGWSRSDNLLQLGGASVAYCVQGDELWIGGNNEGSEPKVSYKFKRRSCEGTPLACAERTLEQCLSPHSGCIVGTCKPVTGGMSARCAAAGSASECGVLSGCTWDPARCSGAAGESCEFEMCEAEPGCTWGAPRERCGGWATPCKGRDLTQCAGNGCSVRACQPLFDAPDCGLLSNADCAKAPGCTLSSGASPVCAGTTACISQTDVAICTRLGCSASSHCAGTPPDCASLSVEACHSVSGCRIEW
jgi:hypothetical protein